MASTKNLTTYTKIWDTIQEPRIVTFLMILTYLICILSGVFVISYAIDGNGQIYEPLGWITGIVLILSGVTGIPSAWSGKHWIEAGAAIGMTFGGLLVLLTLSIAYWGHHTLYSFGPDAWFIVSWASTGMIFGLTRFERCRLAPYAFGKGPLMPDRRKNLALRQMDQDWKTAKINREE